MPSIGHKLTEERESRGASLDDVAARSGVARSYLEALEGDEIAALPGRAFGKYYIRVYAELLGFDPAPLIAEYDEATRDATDALVAPPEPAVDPSPLRDDLKSALRRARASRLSRRDGQREREAAAGAGPAEHARAAAGAGAGQDADHAPSTAPAGATAAGSGVLPTLPGPPSVPASDGRSGDRSSVATGGDGVAEPDDGPAGPDAGRPDERHEASRPGYARADAEEGAVAFDAASVVDDLVGDPPAVRDEAGLPIAPLAGITALFVALLVVAWGVLARGTGDDATIVGDAVPAESVAAGPDVAVVAERPDSRAAAAVLPETSLETSPRELPAPQGATAAIGTRLRVTEHGVGSAVKDHRLVGATRRFEEGETVAFLTRVVGGRRGESIRHVWLREGGRVQSIELPLGGAHWRTHSTKTAWGRGRWSVEARAADGTLLARATFEVDRRR